MHLKIHKSGIRIWVFLIIFFSPLHSFSQDISGVWTGKLYNDTTKEYIPFELAINESNGKESGFSHTTFISGNGKNVGVKSVKIKIKDDEVIVEDEKFIYNNFPEPPPKGVKMYATLNLSKRDSTEILKGTWKTNATRIYRPLTGTIYLERKKKHPEETAIVKKLSDLGLSDQLSFLPPPQNVSSPTNEELAKAQKAKEDSLKQIEEQEALAKAQKAKEDSLKQIQEQEALAKAQKAKEDSLKQIQEQEALAKAQKAKEDSLKQIQEQEALAKAQKAKEDSLKQIQEQEALAKAQKAKEDSLKQIQEQEALAKAQKAKEDSLKQIEEQEALAKAQKAKEDSIKHQQEMEALAKAAQEKLLHAQQAKDELARQRLAQEELAKEQKAKEELAKQKQEQEELAKAQKAKDELERQKKAQEELAKIQKANPTAASDLSNRKLETIRTVEISQDSLQLTLYDNGTVDGDTVSVLLNGEVISAACRFVGNAYQ